MKNKLCVFWFRRDLRMDDNMGLNKALSSGLPVLPIFIFDTSILKQLKEKKDRRIDYIHQALTQINTTLNKYHSRLNTYVGQPLNIFKELTQNYNIEAVYCNRDYEPDAIKRDELISLFLKEQNIIFKACKDQVIFDRDDIVKDNKEPYTVYTYYNKKWQEKFNSQHYSFTTTDFNKFYKQDFKNILFLNDIGFKKTEVVFEHPILNTEIIDNYDRLRDFPAIQGTTQLGTALRFGTISIRRCVLFAVEHNHYWLSELIWREFFMQILYHFPNVIYECFKKQYNNIQWRNNEEEFDLWKDGKTGYPIVDAGMRQLNQTGYMHNRARMIAACFLCKHLLIDWRWGEAYFAEKLNDYDLSANNGNWQWIAGCGCDAMPYFRIFNPITQTIKFDKKHEYIKSWICEYETIKYPQPIIDNSFARKRAIETYKNIQL